MQFLGVELDKYEFRALLTAMVVMTIFIFSMLYVVGARRSDVPQCVNFDKSYLTPRVDKIDDSTYEVYMVAQMWGFQPDEIRIPVGSTVDFYLTSKDVVHGFYIDGKDVNMMAEYGNVTKRTAKFNTAGVYKIFCHEYCGVGHQNMEARIIVGFPSNQQ
ncbi:cytochrome c oxidase subunit II [Thermoflavifilum thermophilum]|uniref:Cytochrome c oxidase subunit 2 n=1 Tax=Thermoflavifilum thermophilum TaxID=1393122 RepID=A0A1I7MY16_9BACT|nr:cytochrome c oxidase subunit II [Thermoflavifilum thermophilum]SFV27329.1 cytochrome c oxidase subunit 2 [Thermoflavifilum thermophilum]